MSTSTRTRRRDLHVHTHAHWTSADLGHPRTPPHAARELTGRHVAHPHSDPVPSPAGHARRIGDILLERHLVDDATITRALQLASTTGAKVGEVLIAMGAIDSKTLTSALADQWNLPFVTPTRFAKESPLPGSPDVERVLADRWLPLQVTPSGQVLVAVTDLPSDELTEQVRSDLGREPLFALADPWDFQRAVLDRFGAELVDRASFGLWGRSPDQSARVVLIRWQRIALALSAGLFVAWAVLAPRSLFTTVIATSGLSFMGAVAFKFWATLFGARTHTDPAATDEAVRNLDVKTLPRYTILVPVYKEANIVGQLIENLGALDYPTHLLEVLILVEEDDVETRAAAQAANPPAHFQFVTVPTSAPKTKPKACNVGLEFATGEYLVIYDAEDRPDPDQLKKAVVAFRAAGEDLVCVQAALNYFNATENVLTRMFTLEYSFWFDFMLPGLERAKLPIPLGGTSNHFRVAGLRRLGGWDPFNVTEDADLGIRATAEGMRVGVIDSTTYEEANNAYPNFIRQRSRWIKGYMQTTLVHLRHPGRLVKVAGVRQALSFLFLVAGTPATFLAVPLLYALSLASLVVGPAGMTVILPEWVVWLSLFNLYVGSALMMFVSVRGASHRRTQGLAWWGLANPVYWVLHSIAAYKGLWQLIVKPHYWEKTAHGLTSVPHPTNPRQPPQVPTSRRGVAVVAA